MLPTNAVGTGTRIRNTVSGGPQLGTDVGAGGARIPNTFSGDPH